MVITKPIQAGDTVKLEFTADYDSATFIPHLVLSNRFKKYSITGEGSFEFNITSAQSADFEAGNYAYSIYVTDGVNRYTVESGFVEVKPDLTAGNIDGRSISQKSLDAILATIEGVATNAQQQMTINGRAITRYSIAELISLKREIEKDVRDEQRISKFGKGGKKIMVRF